MACRADCRSRASAARDRRGIVRAIEAHATSAGVSELYLYTWEARDFYAAFGWNAVETFEQDGGTMLLMSRRPSL
jgi:N-acetylglutamate synthase-like GNAT family acetyltransferase